MRRILIVKLGALGDVLRTTGLLRPLHEKYRSVRVDWVVSPEGRDLLRGSPWLHNIFSSAPTDLKRMQKECYDLAVNMDEEETACKAVTMAKADRLIGAYWSKRGRRRYTRSSAAYFDLGILNRDQDGSLTTANRLKQANRKTYLELWMQVLRLDTRRYPRHYEPQLTLSAREQSFGRAFSKRHGFLGSGPAIGVNTAAGRRWPSKQMSIDRTIRLIRAVYDRWQSPILLLGGPEEVRRNRQIARRCRVPIINGGCHRTLKQFAALIGLCDVLITSDTLALHIGTAMKRNIIAYFGPTSHTEIELYGRGLKIVPRTECRCFYQPACSARINCIESIAMGDLLRGIESLVGAPTDLPGRKAISR